MVLFEPGLREGRNDPSSAAHWPPPQSLSNRVILVRHGRSTYNDQGRYQGRCDDSVLTEKGRRCAYQTGVFLRGLKLDAIYTSPLQRTQQTAQEILAALGETTDSLPTLSVTDQLKEIDMVAWQGLPFQYVREQFAGDYRRWQERPHKFQMAQVNDLAFASPPPPCFPVLDLYQQAEQFWQDLPRYSGQTTLIVSHGGTNRALISTAIGLTPDRYHVLQQSNCGISVLNFPQKRHSAQLEMLNSTAHIGETLPKLKEGKQGLRLILVPDRQKPQLLQKLVEQDINFTLSSKLVDTEQIRQLFPKAVHLQVLREDFPQAWRQAIFQPYSRSKHLITGLVIFREEIIKSILCQELGLSEQFWRLQLGEGISIIHYPSAASHPVLQALNFTGA